MPFDLLLKRHSYSPTETMGRLYLPNGRILHTIERPWTPDSVHGSKPMESCVPDGIYFLEPHHSKKYADTWALVNENLKVYHYPIGKPGRSACLLHSANFVHDVNGCIAPGLARVVMSGKLAVTSSVTAMQILKDVLGHGSVGNRLIITRDTGATISEDG